MTIQELTQTQEVQEQLKRLSVKAEKPKIEDLKKQWNVRQHKVIIDKNFLPDKEIKDEEGNFLRYKLVNRIAQPFQKDIVKKAVTFGFGNPVEIIKNNFDKNSQEEKVFNAIVRILQDNKMATFNRKVARECYRATEVAEVWYYQKTEPHNDYGFECNFRIGVKLLTPWNGEKLCPHFDHYDKMQGFARFYSLTNFEGNTTEYADVYTCEEIKRYKKDGGFWQQDQVDIKNILGKIPVIYASQEDAEWADVQTDIERLELLFSRHAEINDYHAAPKTFIKGDLASVPQAGESNGILQGDKDTDAYILSWNDSPESIKLEISTRLSNIYKFTQTPDVSFESVKALNQVSGVMLKMLFMDAHLKVMEKEEIWDEYFTRRFNLLKCFVGKLLNPKLEKASKNLILKPKFNPYMIDDMQNKVNILMTANGNKPLISQEKSVALSGLSENPLQEWETLKKQAQSEQQNDIFSAGVKM